jgi:hypothetical protein
MKKFFAAALLLASAVVQAQTYVPADCAITYRNDNAWQGQLTARVGSLYQNPDYSWLMGAAFTVPQGTVRSAKVVVPTIGSGFGDAAVGTFYLTMSLSHDGVDTCAGYGPGFTLLKKPAKDNTLTITASTISSPLVTGDLVFPLNAKALDLLRQHAGDANGIVFGISMLIPRITVYPYGEDPKKQNQPGGFSFERMSPCTPTVSAYCPTLQLQ